MSYRLLLRPRQQGAGPRKRVSGAGGCRAGLLVALVEQDVVEQLWAWIEQHPGEKIEVCLTDREISLPGTDGEQGQTFGFQIDDFTRHRLLEGLDDISMTLTHEDDIAAYEAQRPSFKPKTIPARTAG